MSGSLASPELDPTLGGLASEAAALDLRVRRQGPGALLTHRLGGARWPLSRATAAELLVVAAHLGLVDATASLVAELRAELPLGAAAYWRSVALQRADRAKRAARRLDLAMTLPGLGPAMRHRLERRRASPLAPIVQSDPAWHRLVAQVEKRVEARRLLASLSLQPWVTVSPAVLSARSPMTFALATMLLAGYGIERLLGGPTPERLLRWGALRVPPEGLGDLVRLVGYLPLHANALHLSMNVLVTLIFGRFVESRRGPRGTLSLWVMSGVLAGVASWASRPGVTLVVGASGAAMGLVGASIATLVGEPRLRKTPELRVGALLLTGLVLLQAGLDLAAAQRASAAAHLGGLVAGLVLARFG
ncbi:MAG: rhomboid family intramembrane serine protease [Myxococcales bacterium]|nr:rhomboid family intramembrane serine protease [Myxococcales bacterium]